MRDRKEAHQGEAGSTSQSLTWTRDPNHLFVPLLPRSLGPATPLYSLGPAMAEARALGISRPHRPPLRAHQVWDSEGAGECVLFLCVGGHFWLLSAPRICQCHFLLLICLSLTRTTRQQTGGPVQSEGTLPPESTRNRPTPPTPFAFLCRN